ncbi:MAG: NAD(P)H-hydrate dehydratase [Bacteroidales bacterium]|nr:NAD(P)H-hydrate dehydratase [Bacteroidales bacterium]
MRKMEEPTIITQELINEWYKPRTANSHKGDYGRALLVAGSKGMMGAALLSAKACMRSGVGLLTVRVPECGYDILQTGIPEAKCDTDLCPTHHTHIEIPSGTEVIGIGPGLSQHAQTQSMLADFLTQWKGALVLDADALNILSLHKEWLDLLPAGTILTPHPGEMQRLGNDPRMLVEKHGLIVVLKGHHTQIFTPNGNYLNTLHGNPGMAVGGSGDVLTGIILALLAQHYPAHQAACMGVWLHALAADLALRDHNSHESLLPSDIIAHLGEAFSFAYC